MIPRDVVKLAFQFQETEEVPFTFECTAAHEEMLTVHYGGPQWRDKIPRYFASVSGVDYLVSSAGLQDLGGNRKRDAFGCVWELGTIHHLVEHPLREASLKGLVLPDMRDYYARFQKPQWEQQLADSHDCFRRCCHQFGLYERAWSLRGFENLLMDMEDNPVFVEELIEKIADWMLESIDQMLAAPIDAIFLTDDYSDQRGVIFGLDRFRRFFKPHWKRIFERIQKAGVYSILHVCGCAAPAVPDLIECGLDCLESLQPEAMDVYALKREYGKDLRFWGGLGAQSVMSFGKPDELRADVRRLKGEMGKGGGYVLAGAKAFSEGDPLPNLVAYIEEAGLPRGK